MDLNEIKDFKLSCQAVEQYMRGSSTLIGGAGLCYEISSMCEDNGTSYDVMESILTDEEFDGLGPHGVYNKERQHFLEFLAFVLSEEDMLELVESAEKED